MKRWIGPLAVLVVTALAAHWATLVYAPSVIMNGALSVMKKRGITEHTFTSPVRITPQTQVVVRSSPDLFYSLCRYDLSGTGKALEVTMNAWPDYQSLSFYDGNTNNFLQERGTGRSVKVRIVGPGANAGGAAESPTARGIVLIRRLAPTAEAFEKAEA
ncbi:MAG: DUF1254 domain-containing protein, partial [Pseudomonadota bacterium]